MKHAPNIDVIRFLDVKNDIGVTCQWPRSQARQIQFVGVFVGSRCWVATDVREGFFQRINPSQSG